MSGYAPPLNHIGFVLHEVLGAARTLAQLPAYADVDRALIDGVVVEAGRFAAQVLAPTRTASDGGCVLEAGRVHLPAGSAEAYRRFVDGGWPALACAAEHGGQGLPMLLHNVLLDLLNSANPAWAMFPGIQHGAYDCVRSHATDALKALYLPKIASGEWTTTMCLTEAQAGSDLGLVRTTAAPRDDGSYAIAGSKIFISGGDHDAAENIVHLVLARLPDAPPGTRGLSLFLVPRQLPRGDGVDPAINGVTVVALEHKMGIRGSATCALAFEDARGWLVGKPHAGLSCMFVMMNAARLGVGMQALGATELAYQASLAYARERRQGRGPAGEAAPAALVEHADVRRMLLTQKAWTEGARLLGYWLSLQLDIATAHADAQARATAERRLALLTPVAKAFLSDNAFEAANLAVQIHGGHGYITEAGVEQMVRDVRVFSIYEGSNGIQALDLLLRKVSGDGGAALRELLEAMQAALSSELPECFEQPRRQWQALVNALRELSSAPPAASDAGLVAAHFLRALGHAVMGWRFLDAMPAAAARRNGASLLSTAEFYFAQLFPEAFYRLDLVRAGGGIAARAEAVLFS